VPKARDRAGPLMHSGNIAAAHILHGWVSRHGRKNFFHPPPNHTTGGRAGIPSPTAHSAAEPRPAFDRVANPAIMAARAQNQREAPNQTVHRGFLSESLSSTCGGRTGLGGSVAAVVVAWDLLDVRFCFRLAVAGDCCVNRFLFDETGFGGLCVSGARPARRHRPERSRRWSLPARNPG